MSIYLYQQDTRACPNQRRAPHPRPMLVIGYPEQPIGAVPAARTQLGGYGAVKPQNGVERRRDAYKRPFLTAVGGHIHHLQKRLVTLPEGDTRRLAVLDSIAYWEARLDAAEVVK